MDDLETWKPIPGFGDHYEASSLGRIRAKPRTVVKPGKGKDNIFRYASRVLSANRRGRTPHLCVNLTSGGKTQTVFVHTLVLMAFVGHRPPCMEACHNNGDATDNRPENLRWDTHLANNRDRLKHGTYATGEAHHQAKLTRDVVALIRASGLGPTAAGKAFGISTSQAHRILQGESWKVMT